MQGLEYTSNRRHGVCHFILIIYLRRQGIHIKVINKVNKVPVSLPPKYDLDHSCHKRSEKREKMVVIKICLKMTDQGLSQGEAGIIIRQKKTICDGSPFNRRVSV